MIHLILEAKFGDDTEMLPSNSTALKLDIIKQSKINLATNIKNICGGNGKAPGKMTSNYRLIT